jgi:hypothetical protein
MSTEMSFAATTTSVAWVRNAGAVQVVTRIPRLTGSFGVIVPSGRTVTPSIENPEAELDRIRVAKDTTSPPNRSR